MTLKQPEMDQYSGKGKTDFQATDVKGQFRYKSGISGKLTFEHINEITWKLRCCGPLPLKEAKAAAMAMAKGGAGDYRIARAIAHLNGLAARMLDEADQPSMHV